MTHLVMIGGAPGVGKSAVARELMTSLDNCVWLDGDDVWRMNPWRVDERTRKLVVDNIIAVLRNDIAAGFDYAILTWVMHRQEIIAEIMTGLAGLNADISTVTLVCDADSLRARHRGDPRRGTLGDLPLRRLAESRLLPTTKIETSGRTVDQVAAAVRQLLGLPSCGVPSTDAGIPGRPAPALTALDAAHAFIAAHFPDCLAAFLAGSVVRGDATPTSDLDIVVISDGLPRAYRESFREWGWPIEVFVHTRDSYREFFAADEADFRPSLARMVAEGLVLRDAAGLADGVKAEARALLERGPAPLTTARREAMRYHVTDLLDDFAGSTEFAETILVGTQLAEAVTKLFLVSHGRWAGAGKWVPRALSECDPVLAAELATALRSLATAGDKRALTRFSETALAAAGGRLFEGYSAGKE